MKNYLLNETSKNPIEIVRKLMEMEVPMHGPIHHIIDGAAFLCAMYNTTHAFDLEKALDELISRGKLMPGATCGKWGVCGACASLGAALAIIHNTGPLSDNDYYKDNMKLTSSILSKMSEIGGPRCCKRNAFISLLTTIDFVEKEYGIRLEKEDVICIYSSKNAQCIKERCPFHQK